jgi:hypothetical protein
MEEFGDCEFRVTTANGTRLRSENFKFKEGYREIIPATPPKSIAKKR